MLAKRVSKTAVPPSALTKWERTPTWMPVPVAGSYCSNQGPPLAPGLMAMGSTSRYLPVTAVD